MAGLGWLDGLAAENLQMKRKLVYIFENGKVCLHRKKSFRMGNSNKQFLLIFFLRVSGLGFRV